MKLPGPRARTAFISQGLLSSGNFVAAVLLVRALGLGGYGALSIALIAAGYAAGLGQALICQPLLSLAPKVDGEERRRRVRDAVLLAAALGTVLAVLACGAWVLADSAGLDVEGLGLDPVGCAALVALRAFAPVLRGALFALGRGRWTIAFDTVGSWGVVALLLGAGSETMVLPGQALWLMVAGCVAACVLGLVALWDLRSGPLPRREAALMHWKNGRWLAANQVLSWVGTGGFLGATALVLGPVGLGAIRAAQSLVGVVLVACQALELALPARAAVALGSEGVGGLRRWVDGTGRRLLAAFACLGAGLALLAPLLLGTLFPDVDRLLAGSALVGLAWLPVAAALTGLLQVGFRTLEDTRPIFLAYATSSVVSGALALPLVQTFGLMGAAWGLTGAQWLFTLCLAGLFVRSTDASRTPVAPGVPTSYMG